jgi:signal transduction histidine kinase
MARLDQLNIVGQMAAGIGHEIRNPMTAIRGFLQILERKPECQKYKEYFQLMIDELDRANSIITEFLSLAKIKPSKLKKQNLNRIIEALNPLITADVMNTSNDIVFELRDVPDYSINEKEIRQLILNLVRNGVEAMSASGTLTVETCATDNEIVLSVKDEGKGIEPEVLDKIGNPFFTTKDQGTGLGLATCYSIAARHNAAITIETGTSGTTFFVRFKLL